MDIGTIILALIVIGIVVVIVLANRDYTDHKNEVAKKFTTAEAKLSTEREDRLGNINYVVDKVNTVNSAIFADFTSNVDTQTKAHDALASSFNNLAGSLNGLMRFNTSSNLGGSPAYVPLLNLPGVGVVDIELMKHVTAMSGLTVKGMMTTSNVEICNSNQCIKFPDSKGDTYLTSLTAGRSIVLDAPTTINSSLLLQGSATESKPVTLKPSTGGVLNVVGDKVGISADPTWLPSAALHVMAATSQDPLRITTGGAADAILVNANGDIQIGGAQGPVLSKGADNTLTITGNVAISGNLSVTGTGNINGKEVNATAAG